MSTTFSNVTIVGLGLIGGSWGLALKQRGFAGQVVGCDRPRVLKRALVRGAIDVEEAVLAAAVRGADLVILAGPVGVILEQLALMQDALSPRALVTDTGSTKRAILERAGQAFRRPALFLGGHPLAGKEQSGIDNADPDLFEGARYVLSALAARDLEDERVLAFRALLEAVGAQPMAVDAETHDRSMAFLSHLPQLVSTGLASAIADEDGRHRLPLGLASAGFRDSTRLADSSYSIWRSVCATNADNLREALDRVISKLERIKESLDRPELEREFEEAIALRRRWRGL